MTNRSRKKHPAHASHPRPIPHSRSSPKDTKHATRKEICTEQKPHIRSASRSSRLFRLFPVAASLRFLATNRLVSSARVAVREVSFSARFTSVASAHGARQSGHPDLPWLYRYMTPLSRCEVGRSHEVSPVSTLW